MRRVEDVVRRSRTSFFWAMRFMPEEKRRAMFAVYAFCREVDDIADEPNPLAEKKRLLRAWRDEIDRLFGDGPGNSPENPIALALTGPVRRFGLRKADFLAIIDGMEMDAAETIAIADRDELLLYCDRVACAVGRLSCRVFEVDEATGDALAKALGEALQLTNILRDLAEDAGRGRVYLPADLLAEHGLAGLSPREIVADPRLAEVAAAIGAMAAARFAEARALVADCDADKVRPAKMMMEAYERIFNRLSRRGWGRVLEPAGLSKAEKLWVAVRYGLF